MYKIYSDKELIYDPSNPEYMITEGELKLELNTSGMLTFTIPKDNPSYGRIKLMKSIITLYDDDRLLFRGRAYAPTIDLFCNDRVECEGELAFFNDTIQQPFNYEVGDVKTLFTKIIENHNASVSEDKKFIVGNVNVTNETVEGNIVRSSIEYLSTWDVLKEKFLKLLGGYLWIRHEGTKIYIDYLKDLNFIGNQEVTQCINLIDAKKEVTSDNLATVIIPLGARLKNDDGEDTNEYLTLKKLTGKITVEDKKGIESYGLITKVVHHENITDETNLLKAGKRDLADALGITTTITLSAADLSRAGYKVSPFSIGTYIPVKVSNLSIDKKMLIHSISIDLLSPESNSITIGSMERSFTQEQINTKEIIRNVNSDLQKNIKSASAASIVRAVREANSNINQSAEQIRSEVSDAYYNKEKADELLESIRTIITQTASGIELTFNQYKSEQAKINGDTSNRFAEITKYIRFVDGDILLGEEGNPLTLRIENDRINFIENGASSAYWQNRKFYAVDGEFINSLKLGKFAFIPRPTGNLSFTKVVD
ncbi:phage tail protein [Eubacteriales bacterium KG125]